MSTPSVISEKLYGGVKVQKSSIRNKSAAPIQITAEQLLREAAAHQVQPLRETEQQIMDQEELDEFRNRKRKEFENKIRKNKNNMSFWNKYANWEEIQGEIARVRSIYERALRVDPQYIPLWINYAAMEIKHRYVNSARNIYERAIVLLPRVSQLWFKYIFLEESLKNFTNVRNIFQRWMKWSPASQAWIAYVKFEVRVGEIELAREVYKKFVVCHPTADTWLLFAGFEERYGTPESVREVYASAIDSCQQAGDIPDAALFSAFAAYEGRKGERERARAILSRGIDCVSKTQAAKLYDELDAFERANGEREDIEATLVKKKRFQYEEELKQGHVGYDIWFDYIHLEESNGDIEKIREVYERAIAETPPATEKRFWRRYIYLWYKYALFEETAACDIGRAREVYEAAVKLVPHKLFTFSKLWILYAKFELRQKNVEKMRKVFGHGLGVCSSKEKLYEAYIATELSMGEIERCRKLYEGYLEHYPTSSKAWIAFCGLEAQLHEDARVHQLYEMALTQSLDAPEVLWKNYIDYEIGRGDEEAARQLYVRLLAATKNIKAWLSFAAFEHDIAVSKCQQQQQQGGQTDGKSDFARMHKVFTDGNEFLRKSESKEERAALLAQWLEYERKIGDTETIKKVEAMQPRRVKKRKMLAAEDGSDLGWEEYWDYIYPGEEGASQTLKLLEKARLWKKRQREAANNLEDTY